MKKRVSILLSLILVCSFVLLACGKKEATGLEKTTWVLTTAKEETSGLEFSGDQLASLGLTEFSFEFKDSEKVTVNVAGQSGDGKYSVDGDEVVLKEDGQEMRFKLDGDKMTLSQDSLTMTFEKQ